MKKAVLLSGILLSVFTYTYSQVAINADNSDAHPSAMLDIKSSNKGLLIPRVSLASIIQTPAKGLMVYQTENPEGFYFYNGTSWKPMGTSSSQPIGETSLTQSGENIILDGGTFAVGTYVPDASAALEISSSTQGFLPPRMTETNMNNISSPAEGLVVYNTTSKQLQVYDGTSWIAAGNGSGSGGNSGSLSGLSDLNVTSPTDNSILQYNSSTGKWEDTPVSSLSQNTTMVEGWPDALLCDGWILLPHAIGSNSAIYEMNFTSDASNRRYIQFDNNKKSTIKSTAFPFTNSCYNKTIEQLYSEGKAFNFTGALGAAVYNNTPIGVIQSFAGAADKVPEGWMICDGSSLSRTQYPDLFNTIGTAWGSADASSFNIPDLRGVFLRGVNNGENKDPNALTRTAIKPGGNTGDMIGSYQSDMYKQHNHQQNHQGTGSLGQSQRGGGSMGVTASQTYTRYSGGLETRPKNAYVYFIIKVSGSTGSSLSGGSNSGGSTVNAPTGAVMAFNLTECPAGWKIFEAAKGRTIVGAGQGTNLTNRALGDTGGTEQHTLTVAQLPSHSHHGAINAHGNSYHTGGQPGLNMHVYGQGTTRSNAVSYTGSGEAHNIMQPFVTLLYCEKE